VTEGDAVPSEFIPRLVALHMAGRFPLEKLVKYYPLASINAAIEDQASGRPSSRSCACTVDGTLAAWGCAMDLARLANARKTRIADLYRDVIAAGRLERLDELAAPAYTPHVQHSLASNLSRRA
jgi:hypothetical protein